ncbi:MAG: hypothetical protein WKF84_03850 [Pyrinomonadaceae bacterium]
MFDEKLVEIKPALNILLGRGRKACGNARKKQRTSNTLTAPRDKLKRPVR